MILPRLIGHVKNAVNNVTPKVMFDVFLREKYPPRTAVKLREAMTCRNKAIPTSSKITSKYREKIAGGAMPFRLFVARRNIIEQRKIITPLLADDFFDQKANVDAK